MKRGVKRGRVGVCVSPQTQKMDAEHKIFFFRVVSVCVSSSVFFFLFLAGPHPNLTLNGNQQSNPALISSLLPSWSKHTWNKQEGIAVVAVVAVGCFPKENFCLQRRLGLFGCEVGGGTRVRTAALCPLGLISWFEWESSVSFPPGPDAETSREPPSWCSDR